MFEAGKTYKTRCGFEARVYATDGKGTYTIHGALFDGEGWNPDVWKTDGRFCAFSGNPHDLMPPEQTWKPGKTYLTRDGRKARIYAIDHEGLYSMIGAVQKGDSWTVKSWTAEGESSQFPNGFEHGLDLTPRCLGDSDV